MTKAGSRADWADVVIVEVFASGNGLELVRTALRMGLKVVFLTESKQRYANDLDNHLLDAPDTSLRVVEGIDTTNSWLVSDALTMLELDHTPVISQVDRSQLSVARARESSGFPCLLDLTAIEACTDKGRSRQLLLAAGVDSVWHRVIELAAYHGYRQRLSASHPLIIKPVRGTGSVGVRLLTSNEELLQAVADLAAAGQTQALLEEYIVGPLISAEVFRWRGETHLIGFADRVLSEPPHFAEVSWTFPLRLSPSSEMRRRNWLIRPWTR